jgi:nitroreductase
MHVSDAIRTKRAVRRFRAQSLSPADVAAILNAGRRAQSSKNEQAWHFIAMQDKSILQRLSTCGEWAGHLADAALGIGSCPASIYAMDQARSILGFPQELHLRIMLSFGYPADEHMLTAAPRKGGRRQLKEIVHAEKW